MMKKLVVLIILIFAFGFQVSATDVYEDTVNNSDIKQIEGVLPDEVKDFFEKNEIDITDANWNKNLTVRSVFSHIWSFFQSGGHAPFRAFCSIIAVMILAAATRAFTLENSELAKSLNFIFSLIVSLTVVDGAIGIIKAAVAAIKGTGTFMLSFVPIYSGIILLSGKPTAAGVAGGLLLLAAEIIVEMAAFVIVPLMCAYFGLGLSSGVSPLIRDSSLSVAVKNIALWILALTFTAFAGLLSLQTTLTAAADTVGVKTAKFFVASFVPVAGPALSEALTTVTASMDLIKSSVGLYAVVAIVLILLPLIFEMFLWRVVIALSKAVANILSVNAAAVLRAVDSLLALLLGMILFVGALFIISISVLIKNG